MKITLTRRYFAVNTLGENEFDWVLKELGIAETVASDVNEIELNVDDYTIIDYEN